MDRLACDNVFLGCMLAKPPPGRILAPIYYAGVRAFGWFFFNYK